MIVPPQRALNMFAYFNSFIAKFTIKHNYQLFFLSPSIELINEWNLFPIEVFFKIIIELPLVTILTKLLPQS